MPNDIIFFETSVLVAGSIHCIIEKLPIEHKKYSESKGLINQSSKKITGITTMRVEIQAKDTIEKAIRETMIECLSSVRDRKKYYDLMSVIFDDVERNLLKNLEQLDRLAVSEKRRTEEIQHVAIMFRDISSKYNRYPKPVWCNDPRYKDLAKQITRMENVKFDKKREKLMKKPIIPDVIDMEIMAESLVLKKDRFNADNFYLASIDRHFSSSEEPWSDIKTEISRRFKIYTGSPNDIFKILKGVSA